MIIGITGISGSGKSTVSEKICKTLNAKLIDADKIAKNMQNPKEEYFAKIVEAFGNEILENKKELNRKKLAYIIFKDKSKKDLLDKITLKYVVPKIKEEAQKAKNVVIDAALLFEMELEKICDVTIGIIASHKICIDRICKRDNIELENAKSRIEAQKSQNFFKINCNYCIINEDENNIENQIENIFENKNLSNENVIHLNTNGIEYLQFRKFLEFSEKIEHCYTLKPLDFKIENKEEVINNYKKICGSLKLDYKNIYRPNQMHTRNVEKIENEKPWIYEEAFENTDGLITNKKDKILSLTFADCICLYFYDPVTNTIRKYTFRLERNI